jgi:Zn-dependent protease with chaperone function
MLICMPIVVFRMVGSLEMHFASLQSSAEAGASAVTVRLPKNFAMLAYLTVMTCILAPALVIALVTSPATRIALNLLLANADATVKALAVAYMAIILAVNSLSSRHISSKRPGWMVRAILRLLLHMGFSVTLPVCIMGGLLTVPVYMPSQLVALRIVDLVIFGTIPIGIFCAIRQFVRCFQTPVTQGALFEMVQEVAAQAGVRVRSVCLFTAGTSTLYATAFRSLWISPRLADTLLPDEMRALLAHAIGRLKYGHPQRILAAFVAANLLYGAVLAALIVCLPEGITSLPSRSPGDPFSCLLIVNLLVTVWVTMGHRKRESQAEEFAVEVTNDADLVINALNRQQELAWSRAAKRDAAK